MHRPSFFSWRPRRLALLGLFALLNLFAVGGASASTAPLAAQLTPRNFTASVSAAGTLTESFTLANTGAATATSVRITSVSLLNSAGTQPAGTRISPASLPFTVSSIPVGGSDALSVQFSGVTPGQKTRFAIAFSSASSPAASTGFYLTIPAAAVTPITLIATPGNGAVTLTFNAQTGVSYYNVYETTTANAPLSSYTYIGYTTTPSYTQGGLTNGTTYYYYVVPYTSGVAGTPSSVASALVSLPAPTNLSATPGNGQVTLGFTASTGLGVDYYQVYETTTANAPLSAYTYIGYTTNTSYIQTGLTNGTTYYYYVLPHNAGGLGISSSVVSTLVNVAPPTNLTATPGDGSVTVSFTASPGPGVDYYQVFETTTANAPTSAYTYIGYTTTTSYTQGGLTNGTRYYYYVLTHSSGGYSAPSQVASALVSLVAPTGVTATPGNGQVTLNFNPVTGAGVDYYQVYETTTAGAALSAYTYIGYTAGTSYTQGGLSNGTTYYYYVLPHNAGGAGTPSSVVSATVSLGAPTGLTATPGNGQVTLNFNPVTGAGVDYYQVYETTTAGAALSAYTYIGYTAGTSYTQGGLSNGTTYYYYVLPHNAGGYGAPSSVVSALVSLPAVTNLAATPGSGSVTLTFNAPADLSYFNVYETTTPNAPLSSYTYIGYAGGSATATIYSFTQGSLANGTTYYYYVVPYNGGGAGAASPVVSALVGLAAPTGLTATPGDGAVTLNFNAVTGAGVDYYQVYESSDGANFSYIGYTAGTTFTQSGLTNGTTYYYYVVAHNAGGNSPNSATVSALVSLPAVTNLAATPGNGLITLTFNAPVGLSYFNVYETTTPNAPLSSYTYIGYASGSGTATSYSYTQTGLSNGTTYYYYVVPVNSGGAGTPSSVASALVSLPPPTNVTATLGNGQVTLNFTASVGLGVQYYNVYESTDPNAALSAYGYVGYTTNTNYTQSNLSNSVTYYFYLVPVNSGGAGTPSAVVHAGLAAPANVTATPGAGSVTVSWSAVSGATDYQVYASPDNITFTGLGKTGGATTFTQTGLTNGNTYYYYVVAYSSIASGNSATVTALVGLPAPTNVAATGGSGSVTITWTASAAPGATDYQVFYSSDNVHFTGLGKTGGATTFTQTGLAAGTTYYYYVVPYNSGGAGTASSTVQATTQAAGLAAPTNVKATQYTPNSPASSAIRAQAVRGNAVPHPGFFAGVTVTWNAVPAATDYQVFSSTDNIHFTGLGKTGGATTFSQGGQANGQTYYFYVVAYNSSSTSPNSATVSLTITYAPTAPTNVTATPGNGSVTVTWNPGSFATDYQVFYSSDNVHFTGLGKTGGAPTFTQTGLTNGTTHYYYVVAYNSGGNSPNSVTVSALVGLSAPTNLTATPGDGSVTVNWTPASLATDYQVFVSTDGVNFTGQGKTGGATTFTQTGLVNGTTYDYYVVAYNNGGASPHSATVSALVSLAAPANIKATPLSTPNGYTVKISFDTVPNADEYQVFYSTDNVNFIPFSAKFQGGSTVTPTYLSPGMMYYFYAVAYNNGGTSPHSATVSVNGLPAPTNVTAEPGDGSVTITWDAVPGAADYQVFTNDSGATVGLGMTGGATSFTQTGLTNGNTYYYYVVAYDGSGVQGAASAAVSATVSLPAPTNVAAVDGSNSVTITWTASGYPGATNYQVFYSTTEYGAYSGLGYTGNVTSFTTTLPNGGWFYVVPYNSGGAGTPS